MFMFIFASVETLIQGGSRGPAKERNHRRDDKKAAYNIRSDEPKATEGVSRCGLQTGKSEDETGRDQDETARWRYSLTKTGHWPLVAKFHAHTEISGATIRF